MFYAAKLSRQVSITASWLWPLVFFFFLVRKLKHHKVKRSSSSRQTLAHHAEDMLSHADRELRGTHDLMFAPAET